MKKHIGETRETVKPSQHQTVAIALTALYRLHSFISHRFYSILHPSFITTKNATLFAHLAIFALIFGHFLPNDIAKRYAHDAKRHGTRAQHCKEGNRIPKKYSPPYLPLFFPDEMGIFAFFGFARVTKTMSVGAQKRTGIRDVPRPREVMTGTPREFVRRPARNFWP